MPLTIGFDLDLTLIDSRPGIAATYRALGQRRGVFIDADLAVTRLGPPLQVELANWLPADQLDDAADEFRLIYRDHAVTSSPATPGARAALDAVRGLGGRVIIITGKYEPNARRHLDHLALDADEVVGWAWGEQKTAALSDHGAHAYVGDHLADMAAAKAAGVTAVGVTTGDWSADELSAAGADVVLADLTGFPVWLREFTQARRSDISVGSATHDG
jgi:phosphoglycolate phosphatase